MPETTIKSLAATAFMFIISVVVACLLLIHIIEPIQKPVVITTESVRSLEQTIKSQQNTIELQRRSITILEDKLGYRMPDDSKGLGPAPE